MLKRMQMLAVVLSLVMTVGCSTTQKWMAGGAVIGGTVGGIWAAHGGYLNAGEGIAVGAVTGAAVGGLVGNVVEEKEWQKRIDEKQAEIDKLTAENTQLKGQLADANRRIAELEAELAKLKEELAKAKTVCAEISLGADVLFRPGSAVLSETGKKALDEAAAKLKSQYGGKFIMVEGHTDSDPIQHSRWKSNWELGAARALAMLHYLGGKGMDPAKMSAATFSQYQPISDNGTADGKAKNRRAVIVIYSNWSTPKQ